MRWPARDCQRQYEAEETKILPLKSMNAILDYSKYNSLDSTRSPIEQVCARISNEDLGETIIQDAPLSDHKMLRRKSFADRRSAKENVQRLVLPIAGFLN